MQIGPRIRIGGSIGQVGQNIKIGVGKALSNPIVDGALTLIPGVGPGLAAAAGAAGKVLDTSNGGLHGVQGVVDVAKGAATGYGAGKLAGGLKSGLGALLKGGTNPDQTPMTPLDRLKALASGGGADRKGSFGTLGDLAGKFGGAVGDFAGGGPGGGSGLDKLLLGGSVSAAAADKLRQQGLQNRAVDYATQGYDAKAPLRSKAIAQLQGDNPAPDLSSIFRNDGNGYDRQKRGLPPLTTAPSAASQMTQGNALTNAARTRAGLQPT